MLLFYDPTMNFTLSQIAAHPETVTHTFSLDNGEKITFRPLEHTDLDGLTLFLQGLSPDTRAFSTFASYDDVMARELCDAINKYDKLRFVLETDNLAIAGLIEFSLSIPDGDMERYRNNAIELDAGTDCRWGLTVSDEYQNKGLGSKLFPSVVDVAKRLGKKRIILWGGVLSENARAIHYYQKNGFKKLGTFTKDDGHESIDMILEL